MRDRGINFENNHILTIIHMQHQHITTPTFQVLVKHEETMTQPAHLTLSTVHSLGNNRSTRVAATATELGHQNPQN